MNVYSPPLSLKKEKLGIHQTFFWPVELDIFETPVTVTPQQEILNNLKFFQNPLKILNAFGGITFTCGDSRRFRVLGNFFVAGGVLGLCGSGGLVAVFEDILVSQS